MLRRVMYTTNAIQSLNYQLRKVTKNRGQFPSSPPTVLVANTVIRQPWWSVMRNWAPGWGRSRWVEEAHAGRLQRLQRVPRVSPLDESQYAAE